MEAATLMVAVAVLALADAGVAQLQYGFYKGKCNSNDVEAVVQSVVKARFAREAPIVAHLLRMQFHECSVNVRRTMPGHINCYCNDTVSSCQVDG
jgi:peroxidase